jgi:hypothetical protein
MSDGFEIMDPFIAGLNQGISDWFDGRWDINNVIPPARFVGKEQLWLKGYASGENFEIIDSV